MTEDWLGRAFSSVFLRPFNGCVPQPKKKRRLFDSHNPNSLMVAELAVTIAEVTASVSVDTAKSKV
jgi:hypothetical protein